MPQERVHSVADQVSSGLVPGEKQPHALRVEFLIRQNLAVFLNINQQADQVAALLSPPLGHGSAEKLSKCNDCLLCTFRLLYGPLRVSKEYREGVRPLEKVIV